MLSLQAVLEKRAESAASFNAWKENKKGTLPNKAKEEEKKKKKLQEEKEKKMMQTVHAKKVGLRSSDHNSFAKVSLCIFVRPELYNLFKSLLKTLKLLICNYIVHSLYILLFSYAPRGILH